MKEELVLRTVDHPEANGRKPVNGDVEYQLRFPLEDGRELVVKFGKDGYDNLTQIVTSMMIGEPSYGDGTTNII